MNNPRFHLILILTISLASLAMAQSVEPAKGGFNFSNMTNVGKISGTGAEGGHGVAFVDVNNDGYLDIYVTNVPGGNPVPVPNYLYINNGKGVYKDEAEERGVAGLDDFGAHGVVFADFDLDGDLDLIVGNAGNGRGGVGQNRYYVNDGNGYFTDKTGRTKMLGKNWTTRGVGAGDFNKDGYPDFVVTNPVPPGAPVPNKNRTIARVFIGKRNGSFMRQLRQLTYSGFTQGITVTDIDRDGDLDLIESGYGTANFQGKTNRLWINNGNAFFADDSDAVGGTFASDGDKQYNGSSVADIDNDGDLDLLVISSQGARVFRNDDNLIFTEVTKQSGIEGAGYTGTWGDFNQDGYVDLVVADRSNTHILYKNKGNGTFARIGGSGLVPPLFNDPRGMAAGDYDNDGDLDLVIVHKANIAQLFRNNNDTKRWLKLKLSSPSGELGGIGAKVYVYKAGQNFKPSALLYFREVGSSTGYISQNSPEVHFGLKSWKAKLDIRIEFIGGSTVVLTDVEPARTIEVDFKL